MTTLKDKAQAIIAPYSAALNKYDAQCDVNVGEITDKEMRLVNEWNNGVKDEYRAAIEAYYASEEFKPEPSPFDAMWE